MEDSGKTTDSRVRKEPPEMIAISHTSIKSVDLHANRDTALRHGSFLHNNNVLRARTD